MKINNIMHLEKFIYIFLILFLILAVLSYVGLEQQVYVWDFRGYWDLWKEFSSILFQDPIKAINGMLHTVRNHEYNQLFALPLSIFYLLPIGERNAFVLAITLVYFLPTILLINSVLKRLGAVNSIYDELFVIAVAVCFSPFWAPVLRGYPDICGLIFILLAIRLVVSINLSELTIRNAVLLGVYLWLPFVLRRWYAYTIITLYLSLPIFNYFLFKLREKSNILNILKNFTVAGIITVLLSLLFQYNMLMTIIKTNYSDIYSAYNLGIEKSLTTFIRYGGYVFLFLSLTGACVGLLSSKSSASRIIISFFAFNLIFSFFIFIRTQTPGEHHVLPFYLWLLLILLYGLCILKNRVIYLLVFLFGVVTYFSSYFNALDFKYRDYFPIKKPPLKIGNYDAYQDLNKTIKMLISKDASEKENSKAVVYGSSSTLTKDVLYSLSNDEAKKYISRVGDIDLRDLITLDALMAKYVITSTPIQTHLPVKGQQTVVIPATAILNNTSIGKAYKKLDYEFKLNNRVTAYIYEKYRAFTQEELNEFFNEFYKSYPEWKTKYDDKLVRAYLTAYSKLGDGQYSVFKYANGVFKSHPGNNTPTVLAWDKLDFSAITIKSTNLSCNTKDPVNITLSSNDKSLTYSLQKGEAKSFSLSDYDQLPIKLFIDKAGTSSCDAVDIILE